MIRSDEEFGFQITTERGRWQLRSGTGSEFHADGPATAKLRGPYPTVMGMIRIITIVIITAGQRALTMQKYARPTVRL